MEARSLSDVGLSIFTKVKMKKLYHYDNTDAGRLHCDTCGYDQPDKKSITVDLIGTPCPKCGANMLTEQDFHSAVRMMGVFDWINKWLGWLGTEEPPESGLALSIKTHNGKVHFKPRNNA